MSTDDKQLKNQKSKMKKPHYFVVNPKSKISLGEFTSFSQAKAFQIANKLMLETQIWGFDPAEIH